MAILMRNARKRRWLLALLLLLSSGMAAQAQDSQNLQLYEQKIKAGLIYNFLKYTQWPKEPANSPIVICIFGASDPFRGYLDPIEERTVNQRPIKITYVYGAEGVRSCHLLFVGAEEQEHWPELHRTLAGQEVLTVGDFTGFSGDGGMIQFSSKDNRVTVELNISAIAAAHLRIYDSLKRLSTPAER